MPPKKKQVDSKNDLQKRIELSNIPPNSCETIQTENQDFVICNFQGKIRAYEIPDPPRFKIGKMKQFVTQ
jgi:hypothetical protein